MVNDSVSFKNRFFSPVVSKKKEKKEKKKKEKGKEKKEERNI